MKLYIHFGIYKAGSSFLQYIAANSRSYLVEKGIFFPESSEDHKMLKGFISKGNADGLEKALQENNQSQITKIFRTWLRQAKDSNCNKVLISAESLVHQLAKVDIVNTMEASLGEAGYAEIHCMGFFRDLLDHALSTYKHRAKSGKIPDYENWINHIYETPALLEHLAEVREKNTTVQWTFRKFQKSSPFLLAAFFEDWLNIPIPDFTGRPTVNESITLSEVLVMNEIKKAYPLVSDYFIEDFKAIPNKDKAGLAQIDIEVSTSFGKALRQKESSLEKINQFFGDVEQLTVGIEKEQDLGDHRLPEIGLSNIQIRQLIGRMVFFSSFQGRVIRLKRKLLSIVK